MQPRGSGHSSMLWHVIAEMDSVDWKASSYHRHSHQSIRILVGLIADVLERSPPVPCTARVKGETINGCPSGKKLYYEEMKPQVTGLVGHETRHEDRYGVLHKIMNPRLNFLPLASSSTEFRTNTPKHSISIDNYGAYTIYFQYSSRSIHAAWNAFPFRAIFASPK